MQAVALTSGISNSTMYGNSMYDVKWTPGADRSGSVGASARSDRFANLLVKEEEWDNGDPPDVVLWGEESL